MKNCLRASLVLPITMGVGLLAAFSPVCCLRIDVNKVRGVAARSQIDAFREALGAYHTDTGEYPTTEQGLVALRVAPAGVKGWNGPYLPKDIPNDPWGKPYGYRYPGHSGPQPDIWSSR